MCNIADVTPLCKGAGRLPPRGGVATSHPRTAYLTDVMADPPTDPHLGGGIAKRNRNSSPPADMRLQHHAEAFLAAIAAPAAFTLTQRRNANVASGTLSGSSSAAVANQLTKDGALRSAPHHTSSASCGHCATTTTKYLHRASPPVGFTVSVSLAEQ